MKPTEEDMKRNADEDLKAFTDEWAKSVIWNPAVYALESWIRRAVYAESKVKDLEKRFESKEYDDYDCRGGY